MRQKEIIEGIQMKIRSVREMRGTIDRNWREKKRREDIRVREKERKGKDGKKK